MLNKKSLIARWDDDQLAEVNRLLAAVTGKHNLLEHSRHLEEVGDSWVIAPYGAKSHRYFLAKNRTPSDPCG
ncbi:hypothetical protein PAT3040_05162, partial [Paenibacillus agaridevorans]